MKYLTIDAVCEMLSISRRTLERLRQPKKKVSSKISSMCNINKLAPDLSNFSVLLYGPVEFPKPDLFIGRSPRWEHDKLIKWLQENGSRLQP